MYKINFYPEYYPKRAAARRALFGFAAACLLLGIAIIQVAALFVSGHLLHEQVQALEAAIPRLSAKLIESSEAAPEILTARELLEIRSRRMDWAPKLAALSERIEPSLKILQLEAKAPENDSPGHFEMTGEIRQGEAQLEAVSAFIRALQDDPRFAEDLPIIRLGNLKEGSSSQFLLTCESRSGS